MFACLLVIFFSFLPVFRLPVLPVGSRFSVGPTSIFYSSFIDKTDSISLTTLYSLVPAMPFYLPPSSVRFLHFWYSISLISLLQVAPVFFHLFYFLIPIISPFFTSKIASPEITNPMVSHPNWSYVLIDWTFIIFLFPPGPCHPVDITHLFLSIFLHGVSNSHCHYRTAPSTSSSPAQLTWVLLCLGLTHTPINTQLFVSFSLAPLLVFLSFIS